MLTPPFYHVYESAIPEAVIAELRKEAYSLTFTTGKVGYGEELRDKRSCLVGFFEQDHWVHGILYHYAILANKSAWRFPITVPSSAQIAVYKNGSFFDWHSDNAPAQEGDLFERKISVVMNISGQSWGGGILELQPEWSAMTSEPKGIKDEFTPGSIVVFPSSAPHRVTTITDGERITLTSWILGPLPKSGEHTGTIAAPR
jgi:predicted 2-oxoglutarate/Fe(II)-dependent dioxygenase YbiX